MKRWTYAHTRLQSACRRSSQSQIARQLGVTPGFISAILKRKKDPSPRVLEFLGIEVRRAYRTKKQEGLEGGPAG